MHPVLTKDYSENLSKGIMVCGINFGYSAADEAQEAAGIEKEVDPKSFFSDKSVNDTRFRNTTLKWLKSWDLPFKQTTSTPTAFERSFFQTNWIDSQTRSVESDGVINLETMVAQPDSILSLVAERQPSVIMFFGSQLIEAFNDIRLRERVVAMLGKRSGNAQIHVANLDGYQGRKYKLLTQYFGQTLIIGMPHPQAQGISDAYVKALKPAPEFIQKIQTAGSVMPPFCTGERSRN